MADSATVSEPLARSGALAAWLQRGANFATARPLVASGLLGMIAALGFPPVHAWWIALPALALFIAHLRAAPSATAVFWRGWVFGWTHLTLANNWIATAFTHQAKMPEYLGWLAVPLLCLYLAVYPGLAALATNLLAKRAGSLSFGLVFAAAWIVSEWLRSWIFTGYPWPPLGLIILGGWDWSGLAILLPWLGTYGLSGLVLFVASALLSAFAARRWIVGVALCCAVALGMLFDPALLRPLVASEISALPMSANYSDQVRYTLVQPYIPQDEINDPTQFEAQFQRLALPTLQNNGRSRLVLWPEGTIPDYLEDGYPQRFYDRMNYLRSAEASRERLAQVIGTDSTLLVGVANLNIGSLEDGRQGAVSARNSVMALNGDGEVTHHYAKAHLVPYGEYLPLEWLFEPLGLARLSAGSVPYEPGSGPQTMDLGEHGRAGIQICYEIVFSGQVVDRNDRPDYLFNPSNDGWFGVWGPPQHIAQARMRAIEEGLPVLRSTTTGISAVIDANGIVRQYIPTGASDMIEGYVPPAKPPTLFARMGNTLPLIWAAFLLLLGLGLPRLLALRSAPS